MHIKTFGFLIVVDQKKKKKPFSILSEVTPHLVYPVYRYTLKKQRIFIYKDIDLEKKNIILDRYLNETTSKE